MSSAVLRNRVKRVVDGLPDDKLLTVADFVNYVTQRPNGELDDLLKIARMQSRINKAEKDFASGKGVNWRRVRRNV
ncbi:MAG TPA: hypothetical protein VHD56_04730 [Tepidisphaeraceae bacterium]|nr:hypothetical protein [Tepidisphaeraceae bacterium]